MPIGWTRNKFSLPGQRQIIDFETLLTLGTTSPAIVARRRLLRIGQILLMGVANCVKADLVLA